MAVKLSTYRIALRHPGERVTHTQTLDAPDLADAVKRAAVEAADMMGGEPSAWRVSSSEQLRGPIVRRAA